VRTKTKTRRRPAPAVGRGVRRPDDACPACGIALREKRGTLTLPVNGEEIAVPDVPHLRCPKCGEVVLTLGQGKQFRQRALEIYRGRYGLLSADEIRAIRERHGLTQAELARLLRLGGNTVSRWEAGRNVQTAAMDVLLRLIRDLPGSLQYLREHAA
jgi:putative zinc finger/helix-turn-helix YgiT family protein